LIHWPGHAPGLSFLSLVCHTVGIASKETAMADEWQTIPEAARTLGKSERTVYRWVSQGRIPVDRTVSPCLVNVGNVSTGTPMAARVADGELERLRERVQELQDDKTYLQNALAAALMPTQRLLEARPGRKWRWPWQRKV